jgi:hypothetical protein
MWAPAVLSLLHPFLPKRDKIRICTPPPFKPNCGHCFLFLPARTNGSVLQRWDLRRFMGMLSSLVDSRSPLPWSSECVGTGGVFLSYWWYTISFTVDYQTPNFKTSSTPHFGRNAKCASYSSCRHCRLNSRIQKSLYGP